MKTLAKITPFNLLALFTFSYSELAFDEFIKIDHSFNLHEEQKEQIKELIGKERFDLISSATYNSRILEKIVHRRLPQEYKDQSKEISRILVVEADKNRLDPFFLCAVIMTESSFHPQAMGRHGEIGLMQILPETAAWIGKKIGLDGVIDLKNPHHNIMLGAFYLSTLREKFAGVGNRYIAAYNMGPRNVSRLLASQKEPRIYSNKVLNHYSLIYRQAHTKALANNNTQIAAL